MKIGIDAHYLEGHITGVGRYLSSLLQEWSSFDLSGVEFVLYFKEKIPENLKLSNNFKTKLLSPVLGVQSNALFVHYLLPKMAKKDKIDILFCPGYIAPLFYSGKIALALHDIIYQARPDLHNWNSIWDKILLGSVSRISAKRASVIFAPSVFTKKEVLREYGVDKNKIFNISLSADKVFRKIKNKNKIKNKYILFVGSLFTRRHLPEVIKSFAKIAKKLPKYKFFIIGENYTQDNINKLITKTNERLNRQAVLWKKVSWQDLPAYYNDASLFIYLSDYEGFGLPVMEAMSCGTPVVTSHSSSLIEVAGKSAIFINDNKNIDEISKAIYRGLTDKKLRAKLIKNSTKQAQKFSWHKCAKETLDVITNAPKK